MMNFLLVVILAYCAFLGIVVIAMPGDDDNQKKNTQDPSLSHHHPQPNIPRARSSRRKSTLDHLSPQALQVLEDITLLAQLALVLAPVFPLPPLPAQQVEDLQ